MWLTSIKAADSGRGPGDDFWYQSAGTLSMAGTRVSPEAAMQLSAVYGCVKVLSETVAQVPLLVLQRLANGGKERATLHPLYPLLHNKPNQWQTSFEWREMMQGHVSLRGNAYSEIVAAPNGVVTDLIPQHPDSVRVEKLDSADSFRYMVKDENGTERPVTRGSMFHLRGLSSDGIVGLNPIEAERENIGEAMAAQQYGSTFYKNGATMPGWIEHPQDFKDKDAQREFAASFKASQTGLNRHGTPVLTRGMKYHELGIKHTDAQFLENKRFKIEDIARIFRVPTVLLQHADKTQTYGSAEQFFLAFVKFTMAPWYARWEQAITRDLITKPDDFFVEFLVDGLLRGDSKARSAYYHNGVLDGWMTRNEVRGKENLNPLPGLDDPLEPSNMERTSERNTDGSTRDDNDDERSGAIRRRAAQALATQELNAVAGFYKKNLDAGKDDFMEDVRTFYTKHVNRVSGSLALSERAADDYCESCYGELQAAHDLECEEHKPMINNLLIEWKATKADQLAKLEP